MKPLFFSLTFIAISIHGQTFFEAENGDEPDHLVPLSQPRDGYEQSVTKRLFLTSGLLGRMVCYPSFSGESCLSIHDDIPEETVKKHGDRVLVPDNEKRFMITVTQASMNFYSSLAENNKDKKAREVKVTRIDREISPQLAIATQRAWAQMLLRTKYPSKASMGFDGETYEFSVWIKGIGTLNGKTWSPQTGSTLQIVELGQALCALAADKKLEEAPLIKRLKEFEASMSSK